LKEKEIIVKEESKTSENIEEKIESSKVQSNNTTIEENKEAKNGKALKIYAKAVAIISIILVIAVMVFSVIFALINKGSNTIVNGVSIKGINVSGLTIDEATSKLNDVFSEQLQKDVTLVHTDYETSITPEQIELNFKLTEAVELAYSVGRSGSILKDNYDILNVSLSKLEVTPAYSYNNELLTSFIESTQR
jgi:hypothetical protein